MMNYRNLIGGASCALLLGFAPALPAEDAAPAPAKAACPGKCECKAPETEAEDDRPQPETCPMMGNRQNGMMGCPMMGGQGGMMMMPPQNRPMMSDEGAAEFADLVEKVTDARDDYLDERTDATLENFKKAVTALVEAKQQFELDRAEKALARAKAKAAQKDGEVARLMKRMTRGPRVFGVVNQPQEAAPAAKQH